MELWSRRKFFLTSLAGSAVASAGKLFGRTLANGSESPALAGLAPPAQGKRPLIISSANGLHALGAGMDILKKGGDTLDAVVAAVTIVEDDPNDDSVHGGGCKWGHFRDDDDFGLVVENSGARGGFANYWGGVLR